MLKKFSFALVVLLVITSVPLFGVAAQESTPAAIDMGVSLNPNVSGDITLWHFWASPIRHTGLERIIAMCHQALPNINVTDVVKPFGDIWTANIAAVAAGSGMPDVIVEDRPRLAAAAADGIEQDLQPYIDRDNLDTSRFWPFTWDQTLYNGHSYGLPFETDVRVLFYNKTLFQQAGLDPDKPPTTWDELWADADKLDAKNPDGTWNRIAFFPLQGNIGPDVWAQTNGYTWVQDGRPVVNDPKVVDTLNWIKKWVDRYGGWSNIQAFRASFGAPPNDAFMSGKVAMVADVAGYASFLNFYRPSITLDDGSNARINWGVALLPNNGTPSSTSGGFALSIPTGAANPDAAWEFIKCATGPVAAVSWSRDTYAIPTDQAAARDPVLMADPNWQFFIQAMQTSTGGTFVPKYPNWGEQLDQRYENIWNGTTTPEQALQDAQQAIDQTISSS